MVYKAARGSLLTDDQAQKYGDHIASTFGNGHIEVTAEDLVEDARQASAPTHDFFEWDDTEAAAQYRLNQARYLLRSIHVVVEHNERETETRAFVRVNVQEQDKEVRRVYTSVQYALSEDQLRAQVIEEALRQLENWRKRWAEYDELATVFSAVDKARALLVLEPA